MVNDHTQRMVQVVEELVRQGHPSGPHARTLLLVMGDHGMTDEGEHGGASRHEVTSALFALNVGRLAELRGRCVPVALTVPLSW